jgi:hypothetical protein
MNIEEFFELSAGKWFSHRSNHHLAVEPSQDGSKSDIIIEILATDHPEVIKLCQQYEIQPSDAACSAKVTWKGTMTKDDKKHSGSTVLVTVPDENNPNEGKLLHEIAYGEKAPVAGRYKLGIDDALTLTIENETMLSEERLWFASPNLRMRVSVVKSLNGFSMASFTSEIRMGGAPANVKASEAANSASS